MALTPKELSDLISSVALEVIPNCVYLRATDQEANISADLMDLEDKVFCLYNNKPTIAGALQDVSGIVMETIPLEISILCLGDMDDNDIDSDELINPLVDYARRIFDRLSVINTQPEYSDSYDIELGENTTKIYDKTMSGVMLSFDWLIARSFTCTTDLVGSALNPNQPQPPAHAGNNANQPQPAFNGSVDNPNQPQPSFAGSGENNNQPQPSFAGSGENAAQPQNDMSLGTVQNPRRQFYNWVRDGERGWDSDGSETVGWFYQITGNNYIPAWSSFTTLTNNRQNTSALAKDLTTDLPITGRWTRIRVRGRVDIVTNASGVVPDGNVLLVMMDGTTEMTYDFLEKNIGNHPFEIVTAWRVMTSNEIGVRVKNLSENVGPQVIGELNDIQVETVDGTPTPAGGAVTDSRSPVIEGNGLASWGTGLRWQFLVAMIRIDFTGAATEATQQLGFQAWWGKPMSLTGRIQGQMIAANQGGIDLPTLTMEADFYYQGLLVQTLPVPATVAGSTWNLQFNTPTTQLYSKGGYIGYVFRTILPFGGAMTANTIDATYTYLN